MPPSTTKKDKKCVVAEFTVSGTSLQNEDDSDSEKKTGVCLHCHSSKGEVQVSCDECASYICQNCHWCHEFQANHEIRVCDRCDGFYCRKCDEMDQCDDCAEVVCGGCSSLLSCKFCGGGLCPDCATACGKCGIVLCSRDSKFAVECDTCKLSYCLVCLASANKDPCVRCGHRPSKRMEQLVHLRLKSIYKAFQQTKGKKNDSARAAAAAAAAAAACGKAAPKSKSSSSSSSPPVADLKDRQAQADAAAAELLAELDQEEEQKKKSKKKKKKKSKPAAKEPPPVEEPEEAPPPPEPEPETTEEESEEEEAEIRPEVEPEEPPPAEKEKPEPEKEEEEELPQEKKVDPAEAKLCELVADRDMEGVEAFLADIKGVPGKAALRKNAKKALKRMREEEAAAAAAETEAAAAAAAAPPEDTTGSYKPPEPLLTLVSRHVQNNAKSECVLHMAPSVVGWVIGKGGQRIRDLMDESGSKVWIDQDSMGQNEPRVVYVSGQGKSVDDAVRRIKELVAKAPVGGTTTAAATVTSSSTTKKVAAPLSPDTKPKAAPSPVRGPRSAPKTPEHKSAAAPPPGYTPPGDKDYSVQELTCEARFVPLLIGRRGWTIKHIQDSSGARVDIDQSVTPRKIRISGKKEGVASAVRMVRDVLSYPHAHLDQNGEDILGFEGADGSHSPPPSSLIMTGDIKSTISASSSLSSTPEPSMSSSAKGSNSFKPPAQLSAAAVIPPNLTGGSGEAPPFVPAPFGDLGPPAVREPPLRMDSGMSDAAQLFPLGGSMAAANEPPPQQHQDPRFVNQGGGAQPFGQAPGYGRTTHQDAAFGQPQQGGVPFNHQAASAHGQQLQQQQHPSPAPFGNGHQSLLPPSFDQLRQPEAPYGQQQQSLGGRSLLHDSLLGSSAGQPSHRQDAIGQRPAMSQSQGLSSFPSDSYQPAHLLFERSGRDSLGGAKMPAVPGASSNDNEAFLQDLWGRGGGAPQSSAPRLPEHNDSSGAYNNSGGLFPAPRPPPHRQHSDFLVRPRAFAEAPSLGRRHSNSDIPDQHSCVLPGITATRADSDMVDSLFGPGGGGGSGEHNLLSGLQNLSMNNNSAAASSGGWSSSWRNSDQGVGAIGQRPEQNVLPPMGSGLLDGAHQTQQQHQQPAQSRFDWG